MSRVERKLFFAVIGILAGEPIIWLAEVVLPDLAEKITDLLLKNEFIGRLAHARGFTELTVAIIAGLILILPALTGAYLVIALIVGKGSLRDGNRWVRKHATFALGGSGGDFAAWILGLGAGLLLESPGVLGISRFTAWWLVVTYLILILLARLSWGWLVRHNQRENHQKMEVHMTQTEITERLQARPVSWITHWWPVLIFLPILCGGVYAYLTQRDENSLALARFLLDGVVGLAIVIYVVYTHDLAQSSQIMADANLDMVKSMRSQSRQWVKDSKKEEYRALLDTLGACTKQIIQLKYSAPPPMPKGLDFIDSANAVVQFRFEVNQRITGAFLEAGRVMGDRLFIEDALKRNDVFAEWRKLEEMAQDRPGPGQPVSAQQQTFSSVEFGQAWEKLAARIRQIARQDIEAD
jgi:hypothetical protein